MAASCFSSHYILLCPHCTLTNFTLDPDSVDAHQAHTHCQDALKCCFHKILCSVWHPEGRRSPAFVAVHWLCFHKPTPGLLRHILHSYRAAVSNISVYKRWFKHHPFATGLYEAWCWPPTHGAAPPAPSHLTPSLLKLNAAQDWTAMQNYAVPLGAWYPSSDSDSQTQVTQSS